MKINVYHNNQLVFIGNVSEFMKDNPDDTDLLTIIKKLEKDSVVEFETFHNGNWKIEKI